jgi:gamma-glutamylcyclotransferase
MLYFAYGSNMSTPRLGARLDFVEYVDLAELAGHRLAFHKAGWDGSAKCDAFCTGAPEDTVIGVVFRIDVHEKPALDRIEGLGAGYDLKQVRVTARLGGKLDAFLYQATHIDRALRPYAWYKQHVLHGARENDLPADYIRRIEAVDSIDDPDVGRHAAESVIYGG